MVLADYKNKHLIIASIAFFVYLCTFNYKIISSELGIFSLYIYEFNSLNEFSFWSNLANISYFDINFSNPIKYNIVAIVISILSNIFSNFIIFTIFPIIFTTISFYFFLLILSLYRLDIMWSILIAFLGLTSFSSLPLFKILVNFFTIDNIDNISRGYFDLLISFSNSFLLMFFLVIFYTNLRAQLTNTLSNYFISFLWCFSIFLHPSIFLFGYFFWLINIIIREVRGKIKGYKINFKYFLFFSILPFIIVLPYFILNYNFYSFENINNENFNLDFTTEILKSFSLYFLSPLILFIVSANIYKIDPFESFVKFWPILIISTLEIILRIINYYGFFQINSEIILDRISIYFLHFFYYVPFLCIISRKFLYLPEINLKNKNFSYYLRLFFSFFGIAIRIPILIFFLIVVTFYSYKSIDKIDLSLVNNHSNKIKNEYIEIKSNSLFKDKKILYTSLDNNLLISYFELTDIKLNSFLHNGSLYNKENEVLFLLDYLYFEEKKINNGYIYNNILVNNSSNLYFKDYERQKALLYWLLFNHNFIKMKKNFNFSNQINLDLLDKYVIISDYKLNKLKDNKNIHLKNKYIYYK